LTKARAIHIPHDCTVNPAQKRGRWAIRAETRGGSWPRDCEQSLQAKNKEGELLPFYFVFYSKAISNLLQKHFKSF